MTTEHQYTGLIAAVFSPMQADGRLNLNAVPSIADGLIEAGVKGFFVCGSTGEGALLSGSERRDMAAAYVAATRGRVPVIIHVGHNSLAEARQLAWHAQEIGADAIAAVPPNYFRPDSAQGLVGCFSELCSDTPDLPFFYYHIPSLTGVNISVVDFLTRAADHLPSLIGLKYTAPTVDEFQECLAFDGGRYTVLFGRDEMLLSGLCVGAQGGVGSTYNFAAPLYNRIIKAFNGGDIARARELQAQSIQMIRIMVRYGGVPAFKAVMGLIGLDCGPTRRPLQTLSSDQVEGLEKELDQIGFFTWSQQ